MCQSRRMNIINCEKLHTKTDFGDYILTLIKLEKPKPLIFQAWKYLFPFSGCHLTTNIKDPSIFT